MMSKKWTSKRIEALVEAAKPKAAMHVRLSQNVLVSARHAINGTILERGDEFDFQNGVTAHKAWMQLDESKRFEVYSEMEEHLRGQRMGSNQK